MFIQNLGLFFSSFLGAHLKTVESASPSIHLPSIYPRPDLPKLLEYLQAAHVYMIRISQVREREVFKVCIEYWTKFVSDLFEEMQQSSRSGFSAAPGALLSPSTVNGMAGQMQRAQGAAPQRKDNYAMILSRARTVMIERMVKPEEVLIVENDEGEIVREFVKESDTIVVYKQMKEILVYLTHLDVEDTETIMIDKLSRQVR